MLNVKTMKMYRIENMPPFRNIPFEREFILGLMEWNSSDDLGFLISDALHALNYSIKHYDYPQDKPEHVAMVDEMKKLRQFILDIDFSNWHETENEVEGV